MVKLLEIISSHETSDFQYRRQILLTQLSIGYEFIRYAGTHENLFTKIVSAPGLWMQRITTIEPEDGMIECGIAAFLAVLPEDPETAEIQ